MKKVLLILAVIITFLAMGAVTHLPDASGKTALKCKYYTADSLADATVSLGNIYGYVQRIVIDSTGTDTTFSISLTDNASYTIWTKANLTSASEPYSYVITMEDTSGNVFGGVPVTGDLSIVQANCDDASMSALTVYVYYTEELR
ncbi:MAG TPA: hypothetical protein HPP87_10490 [Planctomycetes bacterium]|nr:hypothetical protein [Planctomycetota bacterium]